MEKRAPVPTAFGRVLGRVMERRGMATGPEEIRALGERSGFDGDEILALARREDAPDVGPLSGLDHSKVSRLCVYLPRRVLNSNHP